MWDDFFEIRPTNKEMAALILGVFVFLVVAFGLGYLLGVRHVSDHGGGSDTVGNQLEQAGTNIQNAKDGIDQAASTAGAVAGTVADAQGTAEYLSGTVNDSAELIGQCQQIIARVRARGKEKAPQN